MLEYFKDLTEQLRQVPGGPAMLLRDYFARSVRESASDLPVVQARLAHALGQQAALADAWHLLNGETLCLASLPGSGEQLVLLHGDGTASSIVALPGELLQACCNDEGGAGSGHAVPPLALALLAIAMGGVDDHKRLSQLAPEVDYCAKGLLLIASCRLCG